MRTIGWVLPRRIAQRGRGCSGAPLASFAPSNARSCTLAAWQPLGIDVLEQRVVDTELDGLDELAPALAHEPQRPLFAGSRGTNKSTSFIPMSVMTWDDRSVSRNRVKRFVMLPVAVVCASAGLLMAVQPSSAATSARSKAERVAPVSALTRTSVDCNGSTIVALTPPRGMGMPLAALSGQPHSSAFAAREEPRFHWLIPRCGPPRRDVWPATRSAGSDVPDATSTGVSPSYNWAGFTTSGSGYEAAQAAWNIPALGASCGSGCDSYSSVWTALGPTSGNDLLVQAGTEQDSLTSGNVYLPWYQECCLQDGEQPIKDFTVSRGDSMFVEVFHNGSGTALITFQDDTTNQATEFQVSWVNTGYVLGTAGEWIVERTEANGDFPKLAKFNTVNWTGVYGTDGSGNSDDLADLNRDWFPMEDCAGTTLAKTGDVSGASVTYTWEAFGNVDNPNC